MADRGRLDRRDGGVHRAVWLSEHSYNSGYNNGYYSNNAYRPNYAYNTSPGYVYSTSPGYVYSTSPNYAYSNPRPSRYGPNGDYDRDGIPNTYDRDANGDGIPDRRQR